MRTDPRRSLTPVRLADAAAYEASLQYDKHLAQHGGFPTFAFAQAEMGRFARAEVE